MPNILSAEGYDIGGILIKTAESLRHNRVANTVYSLPTGFWQLQGSLNGSSNGRLFSAALLNVKVFKGVCGISRLSDNNLKRPIPI